MLKIVTAIMMSVTLLLGNCLPFMGQGTALAATQYKYQYQRNKQAKSNTNVDSSELPNIVMMMGDDIGWFNISAYNNGIMGYETPNIDKIAKEGVMFTDFYGEQSCTAGRAAFITGQATIRTGMTKVGLPGVDIGLKKEDPTLAELLKPLGYRTGQFGKNHLGDIDEYLPTNHGFDEFYGNLYHLNAEEEPENEDYPEEGLYPLFDQFRPRGVLHTYAKDNPHHCETGKVWNKLYAENVKEVSNEESDGQTVCDTGPLTKKRMETIDEEVLGRTEQFIVDANAADEPFFAWFNTTRMHVFTHLKDESEGVTGQGIEADGMVEHDKMIGELLEFIDEQDAKTGKETIIIYTTDNGAEIFGWPDGGMTPFRGEKNTNWEGAFRVPAMIRWKGHIPEGIVSNEMMSHIDWIPTLMSAVGVNNIQNQLLEDDDPNYQPPTIGEYKNYDVHLDGYNFLPYLMSADASNINADCSRKKTKQAIPDYCPPRHEFIYYTDDGYPSAIRYDDWKLIFSEQREKGFNVWEEPYVDLRVPKLFNLRRDPFERADEDSNDYIDWRFRRVFLLGPIQLYVANLLQTFVKYPPRQNPASFSNNQIVSDVLDQIKLDNLKEEFPIITGLRAILEKLQNTGSN